MTSAQVLPFHQYRLSVFALKGFLSLACAYPSVDHNCFPLLLPSLLAQLLLLLLFFKTTLLSRTQL